MSLPPGKLVQSLVVIHLDREDKITLLEDKWKGDDQPKKWGALVSPDNILLIRSLQLKSLHSSSGNSMQRQCPCSSRCQNSDVLLQYRLIRFKLLQRRILLGHDRLEDGSPDAMLIE